MQNGMRVVKIPLAFQQDYRRRRAGLPPRPIYTSPSATHPVFSFPRSIEDDSAVLGSPDAASTPKKRHSKLQDLSPLRSPSPCTIEDDSAFTGSPDAASTPRKRLLKAPRFYPLPSLSPFTFFPPASSLPPISSLSPLPPLSPLASLTPFSSIIAAEATLNGPSDIATNIVSSPTPSLTPSINATEATFKGPSDIASDHIPPPAPSTPTRSNSPEATLDGPSDITPNPVSGTPHPEAPACSTPVDYRQLITHLKTPELKVPHFRFCNPDIPDIPGRFVSPSRFRPEDWDRHNWTWSEWDSPSREFSVSFQLCCSLQAMLLT